MATLRQQLIERFEDGGVIGLADLRLGANEDSVGRALRQLVDDGKLVRVGRGLYRKGKGKPAAPAPSIAERIADRVGRSKRNVFLRRDFETLGSYDSIGRALRQLVGRGRLVQIGYGLYAKAERSPFSGKPAPVVGISRLAKEAVARLGKTVSESSFAKAYASGRSTQVPTGRRVAVDGRIRRRIGYDGKYVSFERAR